MFVSKYAFLSVSIFLIIGCSSTPKESIDGMYNAMKKGDLEELQKYATKGTVSIIGLNATIKCKKNPINYDYQKNLIEDCMKETFKDIEINKISIKQISNIKAVANVIKTINGKKTTEKIKLIKINNNWKVYMHN